MEKTIFESDFIRRQRLSYFEKLFSVVANRDLNVTEKPEEPAPVENPQELILFNTNIGVLHEILEKSAEFASVADKLPQPPQSSDVLEKPAELTRVGNRPEEPGLIEGSSSSPVEEEWEEFFPYSVWEDNWYLPDSDLPKPILNILPSTLNKEEFGTNQLLVTFTPKPPSTSGLNGILHNSDEESDSIHNSSTSGLNGTLFNNNDESESIHNSIWYAQKRRHEDEQDNTSNKRINRDDDSTNTEPQQSLTVETLATLHSALKACPTEETYEEDPLGLKVKLMPHQQHALAWLLWREKERPSGGLLADDMGLGKTLTMISLVLKSREIEKKGSASKSEKENDEEDENDEPGGLMNTKMPRGGTLVVCPASVVRQWESEINRRCEKGVLSVLLYHGTNREVRVKRIARKDIVITTYHLVGRESGIDSGKNCEELKEPGPLHCINWKRIILDEAHIVRNHKNQMAMGVFGLTAKYRWCLTGTPIQNKELDLYSMLKFLKCPPFDILSVWKRWVASKNPAGLKRLSTMMKSLMLRRTKKLLQEKGALQNLPTKDYELIPFKLDPEEFQIYEKVALFSSTLFMQFLNQRIQKGHFDGDMPTFEQGDNQFFGSEVAEMYRNLKLKNTEIKSHHILVLLLRLRQICCHTGLIKKMLEKEELFTAGVDDVDDLSFGENLFGATEKRAALTGKSDEDMCGTSALSPDNPVLDFSRASSKIRSLLDVIVEKVMSTDDKAVIVSQWTSFLTIIYDRLQDMGLKCEVFCGGVPIPKRMEIIEDFNSSESTFKILLLSLTAGGVGLNLIGGNHLFLVDLHWNPQLEAQASDRIFRVGQTKPVHIYKFICEDTIEERIKMLQDQKLSLAEDVLTGTINTQASKLTVEDLKMLFGI